MKKETVLLLHGLGETYLRMKPIEWFLRGKGYNVINFNYPSTSYTVQELCDYYIQPLLLRHAHEEKLHIVTHSLGGILIRHALNTQPRPNVKRVVMLTPAHGGSEPLELYRKHPLFTTIYGPAVQQSGKRENCFPCQIDNDKVMYELGIVAGSLPLDPLSWGMMPYPHDGRTTVEGTKMQGMTDHITVMGSHDYLMYNPYVLYQINHFIKQGQFNSMLSKQIKDTAALSMASLKNAA